MARKLTVTVLAALVLLAGTVVASSAFTSVTIDRDANIDVTTDSNGIIGLVDGNSGGLVAQTAGGELRIDFENAGTGLGANVNSTYTLGDPATPTTEYAFQIVNQDTVGHTLNVSYTLNSASDPAPATPNVDVTIYDSGGVQVGSFSEGGSTTLNPAAGTTYYVVVQVNTTGLDSTVDLSGTLGITA